MDTTQVVQEVSKITPEVAKTFLNELGDRLLKFVDGTTDFIGEQAPQVAKEIIQFGIISHWAFVGIALFGLISVIIFWKYFDKKFPHATNARYGSEEETNNDKRIGVIVALFILSGANLVILFINLYWALMATFAPRLYLIHEIKAIF